MPNPTDPTRPRTIEIDIPKEVNAASLLLQTYFMKQGIRDWQLNGVCSRNYAIVLQQFVPKLLRIDHYTNGEKTAVQAHNSARKQLREMVAQ